MKKSIIPLMIVALAAVAISGVFILEQPTTTNSKAYAFTELRDNANAVERVTIENADGMLFSAQKVGTDWLSTEFADYPVATQSLSELLQSLVQAKQVEPKTARADRYAKLGVEPIDHANATSVLVSVYVGETQVLSVLVGNAASNGDAYIRKPNESQSWLLDTAINLPLSQQEWLAQPILNLPLDSVASLAKLPVALLQDPAPKSVTAQPEWVIQRPTQAEPLIEPMDETRAESEPSAADFVFAPVPDKATLKYPSVLRNAINSLITTEFEEIAPRTEPAIHSGEVTHYYRMTLTSGETMDIKLVARDDEQWLLVDNYASSYAPSDPADQDPAVSNLLSPNATLFKWQYRLSDYNAGQWQKSSTDFFDMAETAQSDEEN